MLPRKFRLAKQGDITAAIRQGKCLVTPYVNIHYLPTTNTHTRVACIVSKKVSPSAVQRHKYQRWLRACARDFINKQTAYYDMVWIAKPEVVRLSSSKELQKNLEPYLEKILKKQELWIKNHATSLPAWSAYISTPFHQIMACSNPPFLMGLAATPQLAQSIAFKPLIATASAA